MKSLFFAIIISQFITGCANQQANIDTIEPSSENSQIGLNKEHEYPFLDTVIVITNNHTLLTTSKLLSSRNSEKLLYDHFRTKGILPRKELVMRSTIYAGKESIDYDTIYKIQSKNLSVSVISYWLGPTDLNGHCFQAKKAIIQNTKDGYKITNEDFIPTSFAIDSTNSNFIYGYDYECGGRGNLRQFRITLR